MNFLKTYLYVVLVVTSFTLLPFLCLASGIWVGLHVSPVLGIITAILLFAGNVMFLTNLWKFEP